MATANGLDFVGEDGGLFLMDEEVESKGKAMDQYEGLKSNLCNWQPCPRGTPGDGPIRFQNLRDDRLTGPSSGSTVSPYTTRRNMNIFADHYRDNKEDRTDANLHQNNNSPGYHQPMSSFPQKFCQESQRFVESPWVRMNSLEDAEMSKRHCEQSSAEKCRFSPVTRQRTLRPSQDNSVAASKEYTDTAPFSSRRPIEDLSATHASLVALMRDTEDVHAAKSASPTGTTGSWPRDAAKHAAMYSPLTSRRPVGNSPTGSHSYSPVLLKRQAADSSSSLSDTSPQSGRRSASPAACTHPSPLTYTASPPMSRREPATMMQPGSPSLPESAPGSPPGRSASPYQSASLAQNQVIHQRTGSPVGVQPCHSDSDPASPVMKTKIVSPRSCSPDQSSATSVILRRKVTSPRETSPLVFSLNQQSTPPKCSPGISPRASSPQTAHRTLPGAGSFETLLDRGARPKEKVFDQVRSSRERAEIEAAEACEWLRAAGFPQYAQMFEDFQFPIDIHSVAKDHDFLDRDSIQSLFRRLNILNKCASLKIETTAKRTGEESDEDDQCALSRKWKFQRSSRRWSRRLNPLETYIQENSNSGEGEAKESEVDESMQIDPACSAVRAFDSLERQQRVCEIPALDLDCDTMKGNGSTVASPKTLGRGPAPREAFIEISSPILVEKTTHKDFSVNTNERMKGAKSLLKRLDSLKGKKYSSLKKRHAKEGLSISGPIVTSSSNLQDKIELYNCVDLNVAQENERERQMSSPSVTRRTKTENVPLDKSKRGGMIFNHDHPIESMVCSSENSDVAESPPRHGSVTLTRSQSEIRSCNGNDEAFSSSTYPRLLSNGYIETGTGGRINTRTGSFNFGSDSCREPVQPPRSSPTKRRRNSEDRSAGLDRGSIYDNVPATLHASLDRMPFTDFSLDSLEEQLRKEICNLSNLDHCRSNSVPAMSELESSSSSFALADDDDVDAFRFHRNMSSASMSSTEIESEKQDILNNINKLLRTEEDFNGGEHIVFEAVDAAKERCDTASQKSYDTWQEEGSEVDMDDINAISAEVEKLLNGINENLHQINQLEECNSVHDTTYSGTDDISVASPLPSPTPDTTPETEPKKSHHHHHHAPSDIDGGHSGTSSCQDTSEMDTAGSTEDINGGVMRMRERRDSGVGSSLSRSVRRPRIRWHSFSKSHRPSLNSRPFQIHNLSAGQIMVLRKLSLLKLTAMMERHSVSNRSWSGWIKVMPRFMRRAKAPDYKDKNVFGVPLHVTLQRTGQPLPQTILFAMRYLRNTAPDAVGIFRKPGVRTRIQQLRKNCETKPDHADYEGMMAYDVADMLKQYFRELPEPLLTTKLSETFLNIHTSLPKDLRLQALQATIMLMPDENREVLQSLLLFLSDIAQHSETNQMTAHNLAVCFAPSLFHMSGPRSGTSPQRRRRAQLGKPDQKELSDNIAAHECLALMVREVKKLFVIPEDTMMKCHFSYMELGEPVALNELGRSSSEESPGYQTYLDECIQGVLKEAREKFKGWVSCPSEEGTELAYKKIGDGHPLRLWKCSAEVEAPPTELLNRLLRDRHSWDEDYAKWRVVEKLDHETEVFQYVRNSMAPHPSRDYCVVRKWKADLPRGACVLVSTSVDHPDAELVGGVRGTVLASRYLIEPCGAGKSRLTYICRIDSRGRSVEWYNKAFGQMSANMIGRLRDSFKHSTTDGPETKV